MSAVNSLKTLINLNYSIKDKGTKIIPVPTLLFDLSTLEQDVSAHSGHLKCT